MRIIYRESKLFLKHLRRLPKPIQLRVRQAILSFQEDPNQPELRNHPLKGKMKGVWSISAGGDIRIHYQKLRNGDIIILFIDVGTHSQLY
jgi:addiction module RelE/StbE family toxin